MTKRKKWYIGGGIVVCLIIAGLIFFRHDVHFQSPVIFLPAPQNIINNNKRATLSQEQSYSLRGLRQVSGGTVANELSYQDALLVYQGRALQFNGNCRATPITLLIPPKNVVMLGNDSQYQRTITIGERVYAVAPYDYVLASFNSTGQYNVSCDSVQNVAIISTQ